MHARFVVGGQTPPGISATQAKPFCARTPSVAAHTTSPSRRNHMALSVLPDRRAAHDPEGAAVADDTTNLNNAELLDAVERAAAILRRHGVSAGDVVAIKMPNTVDFVVNMFATWRLGAAVTPVNPSLS